MITPAHAEWVSLRETYHHVLAQSPSPRAADIAIMIARKNGLRLRCTLREHKAQPGILIEKGAKPPPAPMEVTSDYAIPSDVGLTHSIAGFGPDYERNYATWRDPVTKSLFEYIDIVTHRDDVLAQWPLPQAPEIVTPPSPAPPPRYTLPENKPRGFERSDLVWATMRALVDIRNENPTLYPVLIQDQLVDLVKAHFKSTLPRSVELWAKVGDGLKG